MRTKVTTIETVCKGFSVVVLVYNTHDTNDYRGGAYAVNASSFTARSPKVRVGDDLTQFTCELSLFDVLSSPLPRGFSGFSSFYRNQRESSWVSVVHIHKIVNVVVLSVSGSRPTSAKAAKTISLAVLTNKTKKQSKAKQSKAKQSKAKQSKAKQSKAKQSKAKQSKAKQSKAKQSKAKQSKAKQSKAKQSKAKQSKAKQSKAKQSKAKQNKVTH